MFAFFKNDNDENESTNGQSDGLSIGLDTIGVAQLVAPELDNIEVQRQMLLALKLTLTPEEQQAFAADIQSAENSFAMGQKAGGMVITRLAQALNNKEMRNVLQAAVGGPLALACCDVSREDYCTRAVSHGLDKLAFLPRLTGVQLGMAA